MVVRECRVTLSSKLLIPKGILEYHKVVNSQINSKSFHRKSQPFKYKQKLETHSQTSRNPLVKMGKRLSER